MRYYLLYIRAQTYEVHKLRFAFPEEGAAGTIDEYGVVSPALTARGLLSWSFANSSGYFKWALLVCTEQFVKSAILESPSVRNYGLVIPAVTIGGNRVFCPANNWRFPPSGVPRQSGPFPSDGVDNRQVMASVTYGQALILMRGADQTSYGLKIEHGQKMMHGPVVAESEDLDSAPTQIWLPSDDTWFADYGLAAVVEVPQVVAPPAPEPTAVAPTQSASGFDNVELTEAVRTVSRQVHEARLLLASLASTVGTLAANSAATVHVMDRLEWLRDGAVKTNENVLAVGTDVMNGLTVIEAKIPTRVSRIGESLVTAILGSAITES